MGYHRIQLARGDGTPCDDIRCVEAWNPSVDELESIGTEFGLHELAIEDALEAQQRPKIERYGETAFIVLKSVAYDDDREILSFGDVLVAFGPEFVVVIGHDPAPHPDFVSARMPRLEPDLGPGVIVHRVIDAMVDRYEPVMDSLDVDVREIEATVFGPSDQQPTERIYFLKRQVVEFLRNIRPLREPLGQLVDGSLPGIDGGLGDYFRDVNDHLQRVILRAENASVLLTEILDANLTQVSLRQNEDMRKMSAWAAIFLVPTLLAGVWGMNFRNMPELEWQYGYPLAIVAMIATSSALHWRFKRIGWL